VRTGVLGAHVDEHLVGTNVEFNDAGIFEREGHGCRPEFPPVTVDK